MCIWRAHVHEGSCVGEHVLEGSVLRCVYLSRSERECFRERFDKLRHGQPAKACAPRPGMGNVSTSSESSVRVPFSAHLKRQTNVETERVCPAATRQHLVCPLHMRRPLLFDFVRQGPLLCLLRCRLGCCRFLHLLLLLHLYIACHACQLNTKQATEAKVMPTRKPTRKPARRTHARLQGGHTRRLQAGQVRAKSLRPTEKTPCTGSGVSLNNMSSTLRCWSVCRTWSSVILPSP